MLQKLNISLIPSCNLSAPSATQYAFVSRPLPALGSLAHLSPGSTKREIDRFSVFPPGLLLSPLVLTLTRRVPLFSPLLSFARRLCGLHVEKNIRRTHSPPTFIRLLIQACSFRCINFFLPRYSKTSLFIYIEFKLFHFFQLTELESALTAVHESSDSRVACVSNMALRTTVTFLFQPRLSAYLLILIC